MAFRQACVCAAAGPLISDEDTETPAASLDRPAALPTQNVHTEFPLRAIRSTRHTFEASRLVIVQQSGEAMMDLSGFRNATLPVYLISGMP